MKIQFGTYQIQLMKDLIARRLTEIQSAKRALNIADPDFKQKQSDLVFEYKDLILLEDTIFETNE